MSSCRKICRTASARSSGNVTPRARSNLPGADEQVEEWSAYTGNQLRLEDKTQGDDKTYELTKSPGPLNGGLYTCSGSHHAKTDTQGSA
jgi:hypothetical protein